MKVEPFRVLLICRGPDKLVELGVHLTRQSPYKIESVFVDDVEPSADKYS